MLLGRSDVGGAGACCPHPGTSGGSLGSFSSSSSRHEHVSPSARSRIKNADALSSWTCLCCLLIKCDKQAKSGSKMSAGPDSCLSAPPPASQACSFGLSPRGGGAARRLMVGCWAPDAGLKGCGRWWISAAGIWRAVQTGRGALENPLSLCRCVPQGPGGSSDALVIYPLCPSIKEVCLMCVRGCANRAVH